MPAHIGIVACSAPGAALCYETICTEAPAHWGTHEHPEISIHGFNFAEHVRLMQAGDWQGVGKLLLDSTEKLASIGATLAICPDNTAHQALDEVLPRMPIPWVHIVDAVIREAKRLDLGRLGVLGTRYLMEGPVYSERLTQAGIYWVIPESRDREVVDRMIFGDLVYGRVTEDARAELRRMIELLRDDHDCDAVVLGCTELPLVATEGVSPLPTLDSTRLLARLAIERSLSE